MATTRNTIMNIRTALFAISIAAFGVARAQTPA